MGARSTSHGTSRPDERPRTGVSIRKAGEIIGVQASTIRSWERRYRLTAPPVTAGGHRRYQEHDLQRLALMRDEIVRGRAPAEAAAAAQRTVDRPPPTRGLTDDFLAAARGLDGSGLHRALDDAVERLGLEAAVDDVLMTAMRLVGLMWRTGRCDVAEEHLATQAARTWLAQRTRDAGPPSSRRPVVLACGPDSQHTLGLEALGLLLALRGLPCIHLGARTPAEGLARVTVQIDAAGVVVAEQMAVNRRAAVTSIRAAAQTGAKVFYAGHAFTRASARRSVPGTYLPDSIAEAAGVLHESLAPREGSRAADRVPRRPDPLG